MRRVILICVFLHTVFFSSSKAQDKNDIFIRAGFGIPELFNLGIAISALDNYLIGISFGSVPVNYRYYMFQLSNQFFFSQSKKNRITTWYLFVNPNYGVVRKKLAEYDFLSINTGIGRDFYINSKFRLSFNLGYNFSHEVKNQVQDPLPIGNNFTDVVPPGTFDAISIAIHLNYMLRQK